MASSTSQLTLVFNDSSAVWACERYVEILSPFLCSTNLNALFHIQSKASQSLVQLEAKVFDSKDCCVLFPLKYMLFFSFYCIFVWEEKREVIYWLWCLTLKKLVHQCMSMSIFLQEALHALEVLKTFSYEYFFQSVSLFFFNLNACYFEKQKKPWIVS